jgi:putative ABC transport system permease protein
VTRYETLRNALVLDRQDVTRRGVFGLLGVGFLIAALLSALGLAIHSYLSFHRRLVEVGILRSIGLGRSQLVGLFLSEQIILVVAGLASGAGIGLGASSLFVPFLQVRATAHSGTPPFAVVPAGDDLVRLCLGFAAVLALALPISLLMLNRVRLHEAVKLGEEQG